MTAAEARAELLAQHCEVRAALEEVRNAAVRLLDDASGLGDFNWAVVSLSIVLQRHNADETEVLEPILRRGDEWSPARLARMREEHAAEHAALSAALNQEPMALARALPDFAEELLAHMEAEERTFLHPAVLRE